MIYALGVDTSLVFTKEQYYFRYKGIDFKYVPDQKRTRTDSLLCDMKKGNDHPMIYALIMEFISALAFASRAKFIVHTGVVNHAPIKLKDMKGGYSAPRSIPAYNIMDEFYTISLLRTPEQIQLANLYREAFSSNNVYLSILFFWHCLVYPNKDENDAIDYISNITGVLPRELNYMKTDIDRIFSNKLFLCSVADKIGNGEYIQKCVRNSIAHIKREHDYAVDLKIGSWDQMRHLHGIELFLQELARYRLETEYDMAASNDMEIFRYLRDDELV
jgi:hypothetical protein